MEEIRGEAAVANILSFSAPAYFEPLIRGVAQLTVGSDVVVVLEDGRNHEGTEAFCGDMLDS